MPAAGPPRQRRGLPLPPRPPPRPRAARPPPPPERPLQPAPFASQVGKRRQPPLGPARECQDPLDAAPVFPRERSDRLNALAPLVQPVGIQGDGLPVGAGLARQVVRLGGKSLGTRPQG